jgi:site-specific recombinase XerD
MSPVVVTGGGGVEPNNEFGQGHLDRRLVLGGAGAELPANVTAYTLRHSVITDLIVSGLDVLTVARLSGTSVLMIEKHYGHLRAEHGAAGLATLAL